MFINRRFFFFFIATVILSTLSVSCVNDKNDRNYESKTLHALDSIYDRIKIGLSRNDFEEIKLNNVDAQKMLTEVDHQPVVFYKIRTVFAKAEYRQGNYESALEIVLDNLQFFSNLDDDESISDLQNLLGLIYLMQGRKDAALREFNNAIIINTRIQNLRRLIANHFNIGLAYREKHDYQIAKVYFQKSRQMAESQQDEEMMLMSLNRLAESYEKIGVLDSAIYYYRSVLNARPILNDWERSFANSGQAECFVKKGNYGEAIIYAKEGFSIAKKLGAKWDIVRAASILSTSYAQQTDYKNAYYYQNLRNTYSDSLLADNKRISMDSLQIVHQHMVNQQLSDQRDLAEHKYKVSLLAVCVLVIVCISTMAIYYVVSRNARRIRGLNELMRNQAAVINQHNRAIKLQNEQLEESNQTKAFLLSVLSHDLRSPFTSILGLLQLLKENSISPSITPEIFEQLYFQTLSTSEMIDNLILWADNQKSGEKSSAKKLNIVTEIDEILSLSAQIAKQKNIRVLHDSLAELVLYYDPIHLRIIISNLIGNSIKFTKEGGTVRISYKKENDFLQIIVEDNGIGMEKDTIKSILEGSSAIKSTSGTNSEKGFGIGMQLVTRYLALTKVHLQIQSAINCGTKFILSFPIREA